MSNDHYPAIFDDLRDHIDALEVINEKLQAHVAGLPHAAKNPAELSQREMVGLTTATAALLNSLGDKIEALEVRP